MTQSTRRHSIFCYQFLPEFEAKIPLWLNLVSKGLEEGLIIT